MDEKNVRGDTCTIYESDDPVSGFRNFLDQAEKRGDVLPTWWDDCQREECISIGSKKEHWSSLYSSVTDSDIQKQYGNPVFPLMFRGMAKGIIGTSVMAA